MLTQNKQIALDFAIKWHNSFSHLQGNQDVKKVIDTADVFMAYLFPVEDNSVKESETTKKYRNLSKSGNSTESE